MKHYFLSTKMNKIKITDITNIGEDGDYWDSQTLLVGTQNTAITLESCLTHHITQKSHS